MVLAGTPESAIRGMAEFCPGQRRSWSRDLLALVGEDQAIVGCGIVTITGVTEIMSEVPPCSPRECDGLFARLKQAICLRHRRSKPGLAHLMKCTGMQPNPMRKEPASADVGGAGEVGFLGCEDLFFSKA